MTNDSFTETGTETGTKTGTETGTKTGTETGTETGALPAHGRHQLREPNPDFTGRREKLEQIRAVLRRGGAAVTASLEGMGGVGKTETALFAAHELVREGRFKDAQLFIDLQGFTPTGSAEALAELLRPFVPPDADLPHEADALLALWQQTTAGLDMLLFLDNARDEAQVEPLLPGQDRCVTIITSRRKLELGGSSAIDLDVMDPGEAADLALRLANRSDEARLAETQAAELARLCGCLPLAVEVAANSLSAAQGWDADRYLAALAERSTTFETLERGERDLKAALALSLETLDAASGGHWQALGVFEGGFLADAAGAVWDEEDPKPVLADLESRSLVRFDPEAERFHLHDQLRALALDELSQDGDRGARVRHRHATHYLAVLDSANQLYTEGQDAAARGLALLDREIGNIRAGQHWAATEADRDESAADLAAHYPCFQCLDLRLLSDEHVLWLESAISAALRTKDQAAEVIARGTLGNRYATMGELERAEETYLNSLTVSEEIDRKEDMASAYTNLGILYRTRDDLERAEDMHLKSLAIEEELGLREGMASDYGNLGTLYLTKSEPARAEEMYSKSLAINEELGRKRAIAGDYGNLGNLYLIDGKFDSAEEMYLRSLAINEELDHKAGVANQCGNLGIVYLSKGHETQAVAYLHRSLALFRELGSADRIARAEELLGQIGAGAGKAAPTSE